MKRTLVFISSILLFVSFSLAQTPQTKDQPAKKDTKTEVATTKVIHNCNKDGNTCVCGDNCKAGCCVTVKETKKSTTTKGKTGTQTQEKKETKTENPPK